MWFLIGNVITFQEEERWFPLDAFDWQDVEFCDIAEVRPE